MAAAGVSARLPARAYASLADFHARGLPPLRAAARQTSDAARAAAGDVERHGTCAPCLRAAMLRGPDAGCDCPERLAGTGRALLHAAGTELAARPWSTAVLLGPDTGLRRRIGDLAHTAHVYADALADGVAHLVAAIDVLPRAADPAAALGELRRVAALGACLLASFPFDPARARTEARRPVTGSAATLLPTAAHDIGWDIVAIARAAGWTQASLLHIWSDELGYPGLFLLRATA